MTLKKRFLYFSEGEGKWKVHLILIKTTHGKGMIATLIGGEEPHVGAVAIGIPEPVVNHPDKIRSTTSVFTLPGHMDDKVAVPSAAKLAEKLGEPAVVICGLHIRNATDTDINKLVRNSEVAIRKATKLLINVSMKRLNTHKERQKSF